MASVWNYQEVINGLYLDVDEYEMHSIDELKHMLLYTASELELAKMDAKDEIRRAEENVKHLLELLKVAYWERDEARDQLQRLLNKLMPSNPTGICPVLPNLQQRSPAANPITRSPTITEFDSYHSYGSSPTNSFFDPVSLPDLSSKTMNFSSNIGILHQHLIQEYNGPTPVGPRETETDLALAVIDDLVRGKVLPQKGRLLQAVMEAGPLLQTLILSGSLPKWRNPPALQPLQIPRISIKSCDLETTVQNPLSSPNYHLQNSLSSSYPAIYHGTTPDKFSTSLLNFTNSSSSCQTPNKGAVSSTSIRRDFVHETIPTVKRLRSQ